MTAALPSPLPLPLCRVLTIITFHERDDDKAAAAAASAARRPPRLSAKPCNAEVRNYGDVRGNAECEKCDFALFIRSFFLPIHSVPSSAGQC